MGDDATPQKWPTDEQAMRIADTATELAVAIHRGMLTTDPESPARLPGFQENSTGVIAAFDRLTRLFYAEPPGLRERFARFDTQPRPSPFDSMTPEVRERLLAIEPDYDRPKGWFTYGWPMKWNANVAQSLRSLWNVYRGLWKVLPKPPVLDRELVSLWRIPHDDTTVIEPVSLLWGLDEYEFSHDWLPSIDSWQRGSKWWFRRRDEIENHPPIEQLDETMKRTDGGIPVEWLTALETFANQLRDALPALIAPVTTLPAAPLSGAKPVDESRTDSRDPAGWPDSNGVGIMSNDLWDSVFVAASLSRFVALGEWHAREYLTTLPDADATLLWKCLRRLGWWFPDDQHSAQEGLLWWLFRDDVTRLDFSDGIERRRIETSEERLADAVACLKSLAGAATIPSGSCLSVAGFVRCVLRAVERNELPLGHQFTQCGWPDHDDDLNLRIRFDGECLNDAMNAVAIQLDLPPGQLNWQDATGHPFTTERRAFADVLHLFTDWRDVLAQAITDRKELPQGWEATDTTWPTSPIKTVEHLREWLSSWLTRIHRSRLSGSWTSPESYLDDVQRELWNARLAMREWKQPLPKDFNAKPTNIRDAEEQLILLIDGLAPLGGDATTPTVAPTELDFPLEWEFQYGSILTPLEGEFETTASGLRLREDKVDPPHPVRNLVELLRHVQRWASTFTATRRELELAKEAKVDAQTIAEWTARLLDATRRELRNARLVIDDWIDDPAQRPTFNDGPTDIHEAKRELTRLIDGLAALLPTLPSSPGTHDKLMALGRQSDNVKAIEPGDAKRLMEQRRRLAGKLMMVKGQLPPVCEKYLADKDWRGFFDEASRLTEGFLREMDDWMRESCVVDWNDFRVANAGFLLNVELSKNQRPTTAHEAVWLIGQLVGHVYDLCKMANDEPQTFDEKVRVANVTRLRDQLATLPNAMTYYDSLAAESARWQRWLKDETEKQPPKPVERQAGTFVRVPALSEKQYLILETMKELAALSADTRRSAEDIAAACDGKQADVNVFKPLLSDLTKNHKLMESKTGRGGGSWLNDRGVEVANRLVENRKASVPKR